jgi:hypothetical protein
MLLIATTHLLLLQLLVGSTSSYSPHMVSTRLTCPNTTLIEETQLSLSLHLLHTLLLLLHTLLLWWRVLSTSLHLLLRLWFHGLQLSGTIKTHTKAAGVQLHWLVRYDMWLLVGKVLVPLLPSTLLLLLVMLLLHLILRLWLEYTRFHQTLQLYLLLLTGLKGGLVIGTLMI